MSWSRRGSAFPCMNLKALFPNSLTLFPYYVFLTEEKVKQSVKFAPFFILNFLIGDWFSECGLPTENYS